MGVMWALLGAMALFCSPGTMGGQISSTATALSIFQRFQNNIIMRNCHIAWLDKVMAPFLSQCDIQQTPATNITRDTVDAYLCMTYLDLCLRLCLELTKSPDFNSKMPTSKEEVKSILDGLNEVQLAEYCSSSHQEIITMSSNVSFAAEYVKIFVNTLSYRLDCELTCGEYESHLNKFCKSILWITRMLNSHRENIDTVNKLIQYGRQHNSTKAASEDIKLSALVVNATNVLSASGNKNASNLLTSKEIPEPTIVKTNTQQEPVKAGDVKQLSEVRPESPVILPAPIMNISHKFPQENAAPSAMQASVKTVEDTFSKQQPSDPNQKVSSLHTPPVNPPVNLEDNDAQNDDVDRAIGGDEMDDDPKPDLDQLDTGDDLPVRDNNLQSETKNKQTITDDENDLDSAVGEAGGAAPAENPINGARADEITFTGKYEDPEDSRFFLYFFVMCIVFILGYVLFHNKNKVLGLLLEGRKNVSRRRCPSGGPAYRKLDCTLEEAVNSAPPSHTPHIVY